MDYNKLQFICMMGISGSGKSTVAKQICKKVASLSERQTIIVSTDDIREIYYGDASDQSHNGEVFKMAYQLIGAALDVDINVIFDATNLYKRDRRKVLGIVDNFDCEKTVVFVCSTVDDAKVRNAKRARNVPEDVIERQYLRYSDPCMEEGWDLIQSGKSNILLNYWR